MDHWHAKLLRHARHLTGDVEVAADVMQEAWLAAVRSLRHLDDPACFGSWIYQIVTHKCHDWLRRRLRARETTQTLQADPADKDSARARSLTRWLDSVQRCSS